MAIFQPILFNQVYPQNDNETANQYVFRKSAKLGLVIDLNDCYFYGKIKIQYNNVNMHANSTFNVLP